MNMTLRIINGHNQMHVSAHERILDIKRFLNPSVIFAKGFISLPKVLFRIEVIIHI